MLLQFITLSLVVMTFSTYPCTIVSVWGLFLGTPLTATLFVLWEPTEFHSCTVMASRTAWRTLPLILVRERPTLLTSWITLETRSTVLILRRILVALLILLDCSGRRLLGASTTSLSIRGLIASTFSLMPCLSQQPTVLQLSMWLTAMTTSCGLEPSGW